MDAGQKRLALTGGIGCGKSTAAEILQNGEFHIIDTDEIARKVVEPGQLGYEKVIDVFGKDILNRDGTIHRARLGQIVFSDPFKRNQLNSLLHPVIRKQWQTRQQEHWDQTPGIPVVIVIPLLFEVGLEEEFDVVACIACSSKNQWKRLFARGLSNQQVEQRIAAQMPVIQKMNLADYVIWNDGSLELLRSQLKWLMSHWGK